MCLVWLSQHDKMVKDFTRFYQSSLNVEERKISLFTARGWMKSTDGILPNLVAFDDAQLFVQVEITQSVAMYISP